MITLRKRKITIELGRGGRLFYTRTVHEAEPTGHVAVGWLKGRYTQWKGKIHLNNEYIDVWGYTKLPKQTPPEEWANDTY